MTAPYSNVNVTNEGKSKCSIVYLFYERERIKTQHYQRNFIAELFYEQEQIKTQYCQRTFNAESFRGQ